MTQPEENGTPSQWCSAPPQSWPSMSPEVALLVELLGVVQAWGIGEMLARMIEDSKPPPARSA